MEVDSIPLRRIYIGPAELKDYFSEMCPIFKNAEIQEKDLSEHMKMYLRDIKTTYKPSKKLIGSLKGEKILLYTPLLKWYLQKGLIVNKVYQAIQFTPKRCFYELTKEISDARRAGDVDKSKEIIGDTCKLIGNSLYGKTIENRENHSKVVYCEEDKVEKYINKCNFKSLDCIGKTQYEVVLNKTTIDMNLPIQIGCAVYQLAKLRMLEFYYDFIDYYVERKDFEMLEMDTDSAYLALSGELSDIIKPHLKEDFLENEWKWFGRNDSPANKLIDRRTPGLFKQEFKGSQMICLTSKAYYILGENGDKNKFSCKGVNKSNNQIDINVYKNVLDSKKSSIAVDRGFGMFNNRIMSYLQANTGLSYFYDKRKVCDDGISLRTLT